MNTGVIICAVMAITFLSLSIIFALLKEKSAMLISGFNTLPKAERERFDKLQMSIDMRKSLMLWALIFAVGGFLSFIFSAYMAAAALVVWLIVFFKDVHLDTEKSFGKYRL